MHSVLHAFTHSAVWASVIASAFVALVTTLAVQYLAKPRLEARKERILEDAREQRMALNGLKRSAFLAGQLVVYRDPTDIAEALNDRTNKIAGDIEECIAAAIEILEPPAMIEKEWNKNAAIATGFSIMFRARVPPQEVWEEFDAVGNRLEDFAALFSTAKWRVWRRHKLIRKIKESSTQPSPSFDNTPVRSGK